MSACSLKMIVPEAGTGERSAQGNAFSRRGDRGLSVRRFVA